MSVRLTPDGMRYLALAQGQAVPWPFRGRVLLPWLCRQSGTRWRVALGSGLAAMILGTALLAPRWQTGVAAGIMVVALPLNNLNRRYPLLVDAAAMGLACLSAGAWHHGWYAGSLVCAILAGLTKETAPVFAALYAWSPGPLVGLVGPLLLRVVRRDPVDWTGIDAPSRAALEHPWRAGWQHHAARWQEARTMALPWGGALLGLLRLDVPLAACLAVAYAQLLVATDTVRLYQWAAPPLCLAACQAVPEAAVPLLAASVIWNPWAGDGS